MSQKRQKKTYRAKEKSKRVLALLGNEKTLSEIASQYEVHPKNLQNWKTQFLHSVVTRCLATEKCIGYEQLLKKRLYFLHTELRCLANA